MRSNKVQEQQYPASNFPGIVDEYNINKSYRAPPGELGGAAKGQAAPGGESAAGFQRRQSKYNAAAASSRGPGMQSETSASALDRGTKQSPLTPAGLSNRKKGYLIGADSALGGMPEQAALSSYNSQMHHKHKSIDEVKMKIDHQIRHQKDPMHAITARNPQSSNNTFHNEADAGANGHKHQVGFGPHAGREYQKNQFQKEAMTSSKMYVADQTTKFDLSKASNYQAYEGSNNPGIMSAPHAEQGLPNRQLQKHQELLQTDLKRTFEQLNQPQLSSNGGQYYHHGPQTQVSSPQTRKQPMAQTHNSNNESSFLPKIDKNPGMSLIAQSHMHSAVKASRQHSSQEETGRTQSSKMRQKDFLANNQLDFMASTKQQIPQPHYATDPAEQTDYHSSAYDFASNRHKRDKNEASKMKNSNVGASSKLMGGQMPNQQLLFAQANQQLQQQQQMQGKVKGHHMKAHSQTFENSYVQQMQMMPPNSGGQKPFAQQHPHRREKNDSQLREKQDKQLEDLNETLQRLAREKYTKNVPGGAGGLQGRKKQRNAANTVEKAQISHPEQQYLVAGVDPMLSHLHGLEKQNPGPSGQHGSASASKQQDSATTSKKKDRKKQKKNTNVQGLDLLQQKFENQQRSALIMGDPLVNQRLQGVKQAQKSADQHTTKKSTAQQNAWEPKSPMKSPVAHQPSANSDYLSKQQMINQQNLQQNTKNGYATNQQMIKTPHSVHHQAASSFASQMPMQNQKIFKINMTLTERTRGAEGTQNPGLDAKMQGQYAQDKAVDEGHFRDAVASSNSAQQVYNKNGIKISSENPLILRTSNIQMQSAQSPASFRQSQDTMNPASRASNLIGPEKILQQSGYESHQPNHQVNPQRAAQHYQTLNRFNSHAEQKQQANFLNDGGSNSQWAHGKANMTQYKHQGILSSTGTNQMNADSSGWHGQELGNVGNPAPSNNTGSGNAGNQRLHEKQKNEAPGSALKIKLGQKQFSSVIEDVEMEQQQSPAGVKVRSSQHRQERLKALNPQAAANLNVIHALHAQQSSLTSYGGAGFQINRTTVAESHMKQPGGSSANINAQNINSSKLSNLGGNVPGPGAKASKQEIISEIKYHFSQEKEMKALAAAATRAQGPSSPGNNAHLTTLSAPPKLSQALSPKSSGPLRGPHMQHGQFLRPGGSAERQDADATVVQGQHRQDKLASKPNKGSDPSARNAGNNMNSKFSFNNPQLEGADDGQVVELWQHAGSTQNNKQNSKYNSPNPPSSKLLNSQHESRADGRQDRREAHGRNVQFVGVVNKQNFVDGQAAEMAATMQRTGFLAASDNDEAITPRDHSVLSYNYPRIREGREGKNVQMKMADVSGDAYALQAAQGAAKMNETVVGILKSSALSHNNALNKPNNKVGLTTQQDFATDAIRCSQANKRLLSTNEGSKKEHPQRLPQLGRASPSSNQKAAVLRASNDLNSLRVSLRDSKSCERTHNSGVKQDAKSNYERYDPVRQCATLDKDNNETVVVEVDAANNHEKHLDSEARARQKQRKSRQRPVNQEYANHTQEYASQVKNEIGGRDHLMSGNKNDHKDYNERVKVHMSQVFSVMSQDQEQGNASPKSLNDNVQIIHRGFGPPAGEQQLTASKPESPPYDNQTNMRIVEDEADATPRSKRTTKDLAMASSKQNLRNSTLINKNEKQIVEERKVVHRTQTQRLQNHADIPSVQSRHGKVLQSQLNDLADQMSVSKMQAEVPLYLELPGQSSIEKQSTAKRSKAKTMRDQNRQTSSRQREQPPPHPQKGQKSPQLPHHRHAGQGNQRPNFEADAGKGNNQGPRNSSNQQQHRKTQSNISPTKRDRQSAQRPDVKQAQRHQHTLSGSRAATPTIGDDGYVSSDAPEAVQQLRIGFKIPRDNYSFCHEYIQYKGSNRLPRECRSLFTARRYQKGDSEFVWSTRLYLSKECALSEDRRRHPILIVNLDGAVGAWDDFNRNHYVLRPKVVEGLIQLSYDFRLIAVSSKRQGMIYKVIQAFMNLPPGSQSAGGQNTDAANNSNLQHLIFDAVYQLHSQNVDVKYTNAIKNIDEIHFDLTQPLSDMQFQKHKKKKANAGKDDDAGKDEFQTFWETEEYRPGKKVLIFTTDRQLFKSHCYSFDYNYLFQAQAFMHEESKKAPIIIQVPHLRLNPKISFDVVTQTIFTLQNVAQAISCRRQDAEKCVEGEVYNNPELSSFEICKKLLSSKWRLLQQKMKREGNVKSLRVFDQHRDLFVDLELIDFGEAYSFLEKYYEDRRSDWLTIKKYYLLYKPELVEITPLKLKQNLKVTFEESPEIRRIGDDQRDKAGSSLNGRAAATTHDSSKSDKFSFVKNQYISEEAKNLYNALMIRNYKIQQEINAFARHSRIQQQRKLEKKKEQDRLAALQEEHQTPIVIYDSDKDHEPIIDAPKVPAPILRSSLKEYPTHQMKLENEKLEEELRQSKERIVEMQEIKEEEISVDGNGPDVRIAGQTTEHIKPAIRCGRQEKKYAFKYRVLKIRTNEPIDETGEIDLAKHQVVNLRVRPVAQSAVRVPGGHQANDGNHFIGGKESSQVVCATPRQVQNQDYLQHTANCVLDGYEPKNFLIDMLSKRQTKISYSTNQEMHLKNNLNQLVDGEQQYKDQQHKLTQDEKEQMAASQQHAQDSHKQNNEKPENYIDKI